MRKGMAMLVVLCMLLMLMPVSVFATYVASDISGHWAEYEIQSWIDKDLIKGYPDGSFKPDQNVTRAEFMTLVNRAFGYIEVAAIDYLDVQAESWYALEVAKAKAARYIIGYPDGTIKPENSISREEAAIIIWRLKNLAYDAAAVSKYSDALNINSWSEREVGAVTSAGIMQGYPDGSFMPQEYIKRAEVVVALDNALNYTAVVTPAPTAVATPAPTAAETAVVTLEKATATGNFENKDNINEMMTALWTDGDSTVQGIDIKPVFSIGEYGELTVDGDNVTAGLLQWILTQWGGSSVPVAINFSSGTPVGMTTDANWNNGYTVWVNLGTLVTGMETVDVPMTNGTTASYDVAATIVDPTVTSKKATATGNFGNEANINEMMTALWADEPSTVKVQGIDIKPVLSFVDGGGLAVDVDNVTAGLLLWIKTQWGGSSVPVAISLSRGTPVGKTKDANWNNDYIEWVDLL
jgi:hypothetical protein